MINEPNVKRILKNILNFDEKKLYKINNFVENLLIFNKKRNLISKNSESVIWVRHVLDCAQLTKFIDEKNCNGIADLGSGGGFPGIILAIFYQDFNFHVKLYEKSPIKSKFLENMSKKLGLKCNVINHDVKNDIIDVNHIVSRAFRKLPYILNISRENCAKKHKMIIMMGRSAQEEIKKTFQIGDYKYKLEKSITDKDSRIIIIDAK